MKATQFPIHPQDRRWELYCQIVFKAHACPFGRATSYQLDQAPADFGQVCPEKRAGLADERNGDDERGQGIEDCLQEEQAESVLGVIDHLRNQGLRILHLVIIAHDRPGIVEARVVCAKWRVLEERLYLAAVSFRARHHGDNHDIGHWKNKSESQCERQYKAARAPGEREGAHHQPKGQENLQHRILRQKQYVVLYIVEKDQVDDVVQNVVEKRGPARERNAGAYRLMMRDIKADLAERFHENVQPIDPEVYCGFAFYDLLDVLFGDYVGGILRIVVRKG